MSCFWHVPFACCSIEEAVDPVSSAQFRTWRKLLAAFRHGIWTAGMKATTAGRVDQTWGLPASTPKRSGSGAAESKSRV